MPHRTAFTKGRKATVAQANPSRRTRRRLGAMVRQGVASSRLFGPAQTPVKPILCGAAAAIIFGLALDIGPWQALSSHILGHADAQEVPEGTPATTAEAAVPSEADRAALRYFARENELDRLDAELRRLRALYPAWEPPRDLLDPQVEDTELSRIYELVSEQRFDEAREALAERRQRDPTYEPPLELLDILEVARARKELQAASEARDFDSVLRVAELNERMLTCQDVDSLWRVAEAFANKENPGRAYDAYAYVIESCTEQDEERAATLQKAAETLSTDDVTRLFSLVDERTASSGAFADARLGILRGSVARGGARDGPTVPYTWLEQLANHARTGADLDDAMLIGFYLYRHGAPSEAAQWFRFALDGGHGAEAAEAYIFALRATANASQEALARQVAYEWRNESPELMEAYLDAMATILTADRVGSTTVEDVDQSAVDRYVPEVIAQRDAVGAQALGWYAFNTCQFIIAEEWFMTSANWVPTEAALFGLALARLRLGDQAGFQDVLNEWGPVFGAVQGLSVGTAREPTAPTGRDADDPTNEEGIQGVICEPEEREQLRRLIVDDQLQRDPNSEPITFTQAGSLSAAGRPSPRSAMPAANRRMDERRSNHRERGRRSNERSFLGNEAPSLSASEPKQRAHKEDRRGLVRLAQLGVAPQPQSPQPIPVRPRPSLPATQALPQPTTPARPARAAIPITPSPAQTTQIPQTTATSPTPSTVRRRVRPDPRDTVAPTAQRARVDTSDGDTAPTGTSGAVVGALSNRDFNGCVALSNTAIRNRNLSAAEANARGFCLLELNRPVEAAQAFDLARLGARRGSSAAADAVYGATLAAIAAELTDEAAIVATLEPNSRGRRTELQTGILTQRASAANAAGRFVEAIYAVQTRNRIAPLQNDLLLLEGFAHLRRKDSRSARRLLRAVYGTGATSASSSGVIEANRARFPGPTRGSPLR